MRGSPAKAKNEPPGASQPTTTNPALTRIAAALERLSPPAQVTKWTAATAFVWQASERSLKPIPQFSAQPLEALRGIAQQSSRLYDNTVQFAAGHTANHALLWGARGMGKSALIKAVHTRACQSYPKTLKLVEIHQRELATLDRLLDELADQRLRFILFCDDMGFAPSDTEYRALKALLDGGVKGSPQNILFYATSNRRHLVPRDASENERSTAIHPDEAVEDHVSLSDRFGLWLGFHPCTQALYLEIVDNYARALNLSLPVDELHRQALAWSATRGARSGRVAWQFTQDLAGALAFRAQDVNSSSR